MPLRTASTQARLRSLTRSFDNALQPHSVFYPEIATITDSDGADEEYGFLGHVQGMRKWVGDRVFHEMRGAGFTIRNELWEVSQKIEQTHIEDDRLAMYPPMLANLGNEAMAHPDELVFELLNNGDTRRCFDNQFFFDTDHVWGDSGTQSNLLQFDVTDPDNVTPSEWLDAFHAARLLMVRYKNDQGKYLNRTSLRRMTDLRALIPPEQQLAASKALREGFVPESGPGGNDTGGNTNVVLDRPSVETVTLMENRRRFILINRSAILRPIVFQRRRALRRQMKGLQDIEFKDVKFMADARYECGFLAWWTAVMVEFV